MTSRRALFVIPSLRGGGAERVFTVVLNGLSELGHDAHVALCQCEGFWLERLSPRVTVHDLKSPRVRQAGWPLTKLVRSLKPESVLSTSSHLNTVIGLCRPFFPRSTRLLMRDVSFQHLEPAQLKGLRGSLIRRAYRSADAVICLVDGMRHLAEQSLGLSPEQVVRIFNPLEPHGEGGNSPNRRPHNPRAKDVISIGSLLHWKGFDRLIAAFPALLRQFPESTLTILGEGEEREALSSQAADLGIADRVRMPGFSDAVRSSLKAADLFVLSSRSEGMPNVLLEAIGARCPFITLEHPGGTSEILELLGQRQRITTRLEEWREEWFTPLTADVCQAATEHFGFESILRQYEAVLFPESRCSRQAAA